MCVYIDMYVCTVRVTKNFTYCIVITSLRNVIALFCNVVTNGVERRNQRSREYFFVLPR